MKLENEKYLTLEKRIKFLEEENQKLRDSLLTAEKHAEDLAFAKDCEIKQLKTSISELETDIVSMNKQLDQNIDVIANMEIEELIHENEQLHFNLESLKSLKDITDEEMAKLKAENQELKDEVEVLGLSLERHKNLEDAAKLKERVQSLENILYRKSEGDFQFQLVVEDCSAASEEQSLNQDRPIENAESNQLLAVEIEDLKMRQQILEQCREELNKELDDAKEEILALDLSLQTAKEAKMSIIEDSYEQKLLYEKRIDELKEELKKKSRN
jgi:predicted  nucleic acid-binding Zn-ribbon protein